MVSIDVLEETDLSLFPPRPVSFLKIIVPCFFTLLCFGV